MRKLLVVLALGCMLAEPLAANERVRKQLGETLEALDANTKNNQAIRQRTLQINQELAALQKDTVRIAEDIKRDEQALSALEFKLDILKREQADKRIAYNQQERQLGLVLQGIIRLSKTPPEAIVALPEDYETSMRSAKMLGLASKTLKAEADSLKSQLTELQALEAKITTSQQAITKEKESLTRVQGTLSTKLAERQRLQESLNLRQESTGKAVAELSRKSKNLKDLIDRLEDDYAARKAPPQNPESDSNSGAKTQEETFTLASLPDIAPESAPRQLRPITAASGKLKPPAAGKLLHRFGESGADAETSKGIVINTRQDARVTALYDGEVVFTGPFREYGKLVILRHKDNYHSLIAGIEKIDCVPGQFLLEGEPIGAMGKGKNNNVRLYLELRKNGKPIDPLPWIKNIAG